MPNNTNTPGLNHSPFYIHKQYVKKELEIGDRMSFMSNIEVEVWARIVEVLEHEYVLFLETTESDIYVEDLEVINILESHEEVPEYKNEELPEEEEEVLQVGIKLGNKEYYIDLNLWEEFMYFKNNIEDFREFVEWKDNKDG